MKIMFLMLTQYFFRICVISYFIIGSRLYLVKAVTWELLRRGQRARTLQTPCSVSKPKESCWCWCVLVGLVDPQPVHGPWPFHFPKQQEQWASQNRAFLPTVRLLPFPAWHAFTPYTSSSQLLPPLLRGVEQALPYLRH